MQAMKTHSNNHIKELLAWEQLADLFGQVYAEEQDDDGGDNDPLPSHSTYVLDPATEFCHGGSKELNIDRCES